MNLKLSPTYVTSQLYLCYSAMKIKFVFCWWQRLFFYWWQRTKKQTFSTVAKCWVRSDIRGKSFQRMHAIQFSRLNELKAGQSFQIFAGCPDWWWTLNEETLQQTCILNRFANHFFFWFCFRPSAKLFNNSNRNGENKCWSHKYLLTLNASSFRTMLPSVYYCARKLKISRNILK